MKPVNIGTVAELLNRVGETHTAVAGIREDIRALRAKHDQEQLTAMQVPTMIPRQEECDADDESDGPPPPPLRVRRWKAPQKRTAELNEFHVCSLLAYHRHRSSYNMIHVVRKVFESALAISWVGRRLRHLSMSTICLQSTKYPIMIAQQEIAVTFLILGQTCVDRSTLTGTNQ